MHDPSAGRHSLLERARRVAEGAGHHQVAADAAVGLASIATRERMFPLAEHYLGTGIDLCTKYGYDLDHQYLLAHRAWVELELGRWTAAAESAAEVLRHRAVSTFPRTQALCALALVRARRGDPDPASLLDEARGLAEPTGELPRIGLVATVLAEVAWITGRHEEIRRLRMPRSTLRSSFTYPRSPAT